MELGNSSLSLKRHVFCLVTAYVLIASALSLLSPSIDTSRATYPFSYDTAVSDPDETADQYYPDVAFSPNRTIYVVWEDNRNDPAPESPPYFVDIFISASYDMGGSFTKNLQITNNSETLTKSEPSIAIDPGGTIYVAWWDSTGLYIQKSSDGVAFTDPVEVSTGVSGTFKISPSVCAPAIGEVYVAFSSPLNMDGRIFVAVSHDGGESFSFTRVDDGHAGYRTNPDMGIDKHGNIFVTWEDRRNGDSDIFFSSSTDGGLTYSSDIMVNDDGGNSDQDVPSLAIGKSGNIYIAWRDWRNGGSDIYFSKSTDSGLTFGDGIENDNDVQVDDFPLNAMHEYPAVAVDNSEKIFVSWRDTRNGATDYDIYFTSSEDEGDTFGDGIRNNNDIKVNDNVTGTDQEIPAMAVTHNGTACIVWYDNRNYTEKGVDIYASVVIESAADLMILGESDVGGPLGVTFIPPSPQLEGTAISIKAVVKNLGTENATNVVVRFYDDDIRAENQIGDDRVILFLLREGGSTAVYMDWICQRIGIHKIYVVLDPEDDILELSEENNDADVTFEVFSLVNPARPQDVTASLAGSMWNDVKVQWTLSPDDIAGRRNVDGYEIYRGVVFDTDGAGYELIDTVPNRTESFIDYGNGYGEPRDLYYLICAFNSTEGSSCSLSQGAKMNEPVREGWNLLTAPLLIPEVGIEMIFKTIRFDVVRAYDPATSWESYYSFKYWNTLDSTDAWSAYWVHCLQDGDFTIAGQVPQEIELQLYNGWNLVAFPSFAVEVQLQDLLLTYPIGKAEMFDPGSPPYFLREMDRFEAFFPEGGYWIETLDDCTITLQNV